MKRILFVLMLSFGLLPLTVTAQGSSLVEETRLVEPCDCDEMLAYHTAAWQGDYLAIANRAGSNIAPRLQIWSMPSGDVIGTFSSDISMIAWSGEEDTLAVGYADGSVDRWMPGEDLATLSGEAIDGGLTSLNWIGGTLIAGGDHVWLLDAVSGDLIETLDIATTGVLAVSPNSNRLAVADPGDNILIINLLADELEWVIGVPDSDIDRLVWSSDSIHLAVLRSDDALRVWEVGTADIVLEKSGTFYDVAWSPDGQLLAVTDTGLSVIELSSGETLAHTDARDVPILGVAWSPDGSRLATIDAQDTVSIWRFE